VRIDAGVETFLSLKVVEGTMDRYLLFDSGCQACRDLAAEVEEAAGSWLRARSLHDPQMRALLDRARPGWRWEPTLLIVDGESLRAYTGAALAGRLITGVGPRRAARIARLTERAARQRVGDNRRRFLRISGGAVASLAIVPWLAKGDPAAASLGTGSGVITHALASTDPVIAHLRARADVRQAEASHGSANWSAALLSTTSETSLVAKGIHQVVIVPLGSTGTALLASYEVSNASPVLIFGVAQTSSGVTFPLTTPGGVSIGDLHPQATGAMVYAQPTVTGAVTAAVSWGCFGNCIKAYLPKIGGICGSTCANCVTSPGWVYCSVCVTCAGLVVYGCYKSCGG
jgi:hypothetical protein